MYMILRGIEAIILYGFVDWKLQFVILFNVYITKSFYIYIYS
jgi:hypothetical protein